MTDADLDTWNSLALPILKHVASIEGRGGEVDSQGLAEHLGTELGPTNVEFERLIHDGFITGSDVTAMGGRGRAFMDARLTGSGARAVGRWPSDDPYEAVLALIEARLTDPALDAHTRTKLVKFRDGLVDVGKGTVSGVLTAVLTSQM